jgi:protein SCO1/2
MKSKRTLIFWVVVVAFFASILLTQQYLKKQGNGLIPGNGGDFTLQSDKGPVSLSDFHGKVVALYFGYMSCPDICPTSLWNLSSAMRLLTPEQAAQVQGIFVSVDPDRDSPRAMGMFVKGFWDSFIGLTGKKENIDKIARQYSVVYEKVPLKDSAMGYVVDHSSVIYLIDKQGVVQYYTPHNTAPEELRDDLLKLIEADG